MELSDVIYLKEEDDQQWQPNSESTGRACIGDVMASTCICGRLFRGRRSGGFALFAESPMSYKDNGGFWINGEESSFDVVAYVCRLPEEILQRMLDALAAAEYQPEQAAPAT
jgi:hypothetical protein